MFHLRDADNISFPLATITKASCNWNRNSPISVGRLYLHNLRALSGKYSLINSLSFSFFTAVLPDERKVNEILNSLLLMLLHLIVLKHSFSTNSFFYLDWLNRAVNWSAFSFKNVVVNELFAVHFKTKLIKII